MEWHFINESLPLLPPLTEQQGKTAKSKQNIPQSDRETLFNNMTSIATLEKSLSPAANSAPQEDHGEIYPCILSLGELWWEIGRAGDDQPTAKGKDSQVMAIIEGKIEFDSWDKAERDRFFKELEKVDHRVILCIVSDVENPGRTKVARFLDQIKEKLEPKTAWHITFAASGILALYSSGRTTGLVLSMDPTLQSTKISTVAIYEGYCVSDAAQWETITHQEKLNHTDNVINHLAKTAAALVSETLRRCPIDCRKDFFKNIVLSGPLSNLKDSQGACISDLIRHALNKPQLRTQTFKVVMPNDGNHVSWIGGSILASLRSFRLMNAFNDLTELAKLAGGADNVPAKNNCCRLGIISTTSGKVFGARTSTRLSIIV